ncbi:MAG: hypothetical protein ACRC3B_07135 [Bacteroidia bacterium]
MTLTHNKRKLLLLLTFLWVVAYLFIPIRNDAVSVVYEGISPETLVLRAEASDNYSTLLNFNGHPGGIIGILFFLMMPFFIVWESFSIHRPFAIPVRAFLQLQALLLFLGAPYTYYMITYHHGVFRNTTHETVMAWGGVLLCIQNILLAVYLFWILAIPEGKAAGFFRLKDVEK